MLKTHFRDLFSNAQNVQYYLSYVYSECYKTYKLYKSKFRNVSKRGNVYLDQIKILKRARKNLETGGWRPRIFFWRPSRGAWSPFAAGTGQGVVSEKLVIKLEVCGEG